MKYAIIIPTFNQSDYTIRCFESIRDFSQNYEIIWVDDASTKENYTIVKQYADENQVSYTSLCNNENSGFIQSINKGLRYVLEETDAQYILIQNNDTVVTAEWLTRLEGHLARNKKLAAVGPVTNHNTGQSLHDISFLYDMPNLWPCGDVLRESDQGVFLRSRYNKKSIITYARLGFFSVMLRRSAVEEIGLLDENYGFGYYDDDDYCERLLRAGYDLAIALDVYITHNVGVSTPLGTDHDQWMTRRAQISATNKRYFEEKFGYNKESDGEIGVNKRIEIIQQHRKGLLCKKKIMDLSDEIHIMQKSFFWRLRSVYMQLKKSIGL